jgi:hypothetical protein
MIRSSRKVIFRLTRTQRKNQQGTDGGTWRWSAPASRARRLEPRRPSPPAPFPTGHRGRGTRLRPGSREPGRSKEPLQISGKKPGRMPGSGKCSAVALAARTRTRNNTGEVPSQGDGRQSCTSPLSSVDNLRRGVFQTIRAGIFPRSSLLGAGQVGFWEFGKGGSTG